MQEEFFRDELPPVQGEIRVSETKKDGYPMTVLEQWDGEQWVNFDEWLKEDEK